MTGIRSKDRWFLVFCLEGTVFTNQALVKMASGWSTANVDKQVNEARTAVSSSETLLEEG